MTSNPAHISYGLIHELETSSTQSVKVDINTASLFPSAHHKQIAKINFELIAYDAFFLNFSMMSSKDCMTQLWKLTFTHFVFKEIIIHVWDLFWFIKVCDISFGEKLFLFYHILSKFHEDLLKIFNTFMINLIFFEIWVVFSFKFKMIQENFARLFKLRQLGNSQALLFEKELKEVVKKLAECLGCYDGTCDLFPFLILLFVDSFILSHFWLDYRMY